MIYRLLLQTWRDNVAVDHLEFLMTCRSTGTSRGSMIIRAAAQSMKMNEQITSSKRATAIVHLFSDNLDGNTVLEPRLFCCCIVVQFFLLWVWKSSCRVMAFFSWLADCCLAAITSQSLLDPLLPWRSSGLSSLSRSGRDNTCSFFFLLLSTVNQLPSPYVTINSPNRSHPSVRQCTAQLTIWRDKVLSWGGKHVFSFTEGNGKKTKWESVKKSCKQGQCLARRSPLSCY